jgi:hypothetical protein
MIFTRLFAHIRSQHWGALQLELMVVIVGVFLGLQIDNWNDERKTRHLEIELLESLATDLADTVGDLDYNVALMDSGIASANELLEHMDSSAPYEDHIPALITRAFIWTKLRMSSGTIKSLEAEGLNIISNQQLRSQIISAFGATLEHHREWESIVVAQTNQFILEEAPERFVSGFDGMGIGSDDEQWGRFEPLDYEQLRRDPVFRYRLLTSRNLSAGFQRIQNKPFRQQLIKLKQDIEREVSARE